MKTARTALLVALFPLFAAAGWYQRDGGAPVELPDGGSWAAKGYVQLTDQQLSDWRALQAALAAEQAAQAASNAAAMAETPIVFDRPVQAAIETRASDGHVYGLEVDPNGGEVVPVQRESERLTQAEYEAAKAKRLAERDRSRTRIAAIENDLNQVEAAVSNIVYTSIVLTNMTTSAAVWTDAQQRATIVAMKDGLQAVKKNGADINTALRNLRQACEKIRREIR